MWGGFLYAFKLECERDYEWKCLSKGMYRMKGVSVPVCICVFMFPGWEGAAGSKLILKGSCGQAYLK